MAWDFIPFTIDMLTLAAHTDAVCFGTLCQRSPVSRQTIARFLAATSDQCLRIFDINLRQARGHARIEDMLDLANVLKLNDEELPELARRLNLAGTVPDQLAALLKNYDLKLIALTQVARKAACYFPALPNQNAALFQSKSWTPLALEMPLPRPWPWAS